MSLKGYANGLTTSTNFENSLGGAGVYVHSDHNSIKAKEDIDIIGINPAGIGVWLRNDSGTGKGLLSSQGDIEIKGVNANNSYYAVYMRQKIVSSTGSVTINALGNKGLAFDSSRGTINAAGNINLLGYATVAHGMYFTSNPTNFLTSTGGSVLIATNTEATATYYGLHANSGSISANQNFIIQAF